MGRRSLTSEESKAMNALRWHGAPPPDGWPSWTAYRRYAEDADGGRAPYRRPDPAAFRSYLEAAGEEA